MPPVHLIEDGSTGNPGAHATCAKAQQRATDASASSQGQNRATTGDYTSHQDTHATPRSPNTQHPLPPHNHGLLRHPQHRAVAGPLSQMMSHTLLRRRASTDGNTCRSCCGPSAAAEWPPASDIAIGRVPSSFYSACSTFAACTAASTRQRHTTAWLSGSRDTLT
jgi:hypothetical protein